MTMTVKTTQLNNQSILQNFGLVEQIDEQAAEIISGGNTERFTIRNKTKYDIICLVDGKQLPLKPGQETGWQTNQGGIIIFDRDAGRPGIQEGKNDLSDRGIYEFRDDQSTDYPFDIELVQVRR
jgi:hypothetical protein